MSNGHKHIMLKLSMTNPQLEALEVFFAHNGWDFDILEQTEIVLPIANFLRREEIEVKRTKRASPFHEISSNRSTPARDLNSNRSTPCREVGDKKVTSSGDKTSRRSTPCREVGSSRSTPCRELTGAAEDEDEEDWRNKFVEIINIKHLDFAEFLVDDDICEHCFWTPCITSRKPKWLGDGAPAKDGNYMLRKDRYLKYVKLMKTLGCWNHPAYILKKRYARDDIKMNGKAADYVWGGNKEIRELVPECILNMVRKMYPNAPGKSYSGE